jgi:hypothetical protein
MSFSSVFSKCEKKEVFGKIRVRDLGSLSYVGGEGTMGLQWLNSKGEQKHTNR